MNLIGIFRTFHPETPEYTFFLSTYGTHSRIDPILVHESGLDKYKRRSISCLAYET